MLTKLIKKKNLVLILILLLAFCLRIYRLGNYPPLNADEAAIGYNAYSLLETGRDEHGNAWPIHFKSFGDFKPGGYFYLVLPLVGLLGLNEWVVRMPSLFLGLLTIYLVYRLTVLIWKDHKLGLLWSLLLSLSPWHLHFSRGGWESNAALSAIVLGVYWLFKYLEKKEKKFFFGSILIFLFSLYTYHSARIVIPLLVLGIIIFNWRVFWKKKQELAPLVLIGILLGIPLVVSFLSSGGTARFSGVGFLADSGPLWRVNELRAQHENTDGFIPTLFHNRFFGYGISFASKYFSHFSDRFLFIDGDSVPRSKLPEMGQMYLIDFPLVILGIVFWLKKKNKHWYLPFVWLLVAPIASAMTFQAPSALRSLPLVIPLTFFASWTIRKILDFSKGKWFLVVLGVIYLWSFLGWVDNYFDHYLERYPSAWPNFRPVAEILERERDSDEPICIQTEHLDQPYILTLFYTQYPPEEIQKEIKLTPPDQFGFSTVESFGKYTFGDCQGFDGKIISGE